MMKGLSTTHILNDIQDLLNELKTRVVIEDQVIEPKPRKSVHVDFTPNARRKHAIDEAKKIISYSEYMTKRRGWIVVPEFIINHEKKTVVALMKGVHSKIIRAKGIAKCDPSDVFNVNIGKAIALIRALEHHTPEILLTAPNPTEIEAGDIIGFKDNSSCAEYKVKDSEGNLIIIKSKHNDLIGHSAHGGSYDWAKIIDDSKE